MNCCNLKCASYLPEFGCLYGYQPDECAKFIVPTEQTSSPLVESQSAGCAILTETQQFDVLNALRQLTEACERSSKHGEAITVGVKRRNARKLLDQLEHNDSHQSERGTRR